MKKIKHIVFHLIIVPFVFALVCAIVIDAIDHPGHKLNIFNFNYKLLLEVLNLSILIFFCIYSGNAKNLYFSKENSYQKFSAIFDNPSFADHHQNKSIEHDLNRVNILVKQLNSNIIAYAICLIIVYLTYIVQIVVQNSPYGESDFSKNLIYIEEVFNYVSSVFIYLAFLVLYDITLDEDNQTNHYYVPAIIFSILFLMIYFIVINIDDPNSYNNHHLLTLSIGILNGLAMGLFFGRIISMEHTFQNIFYINNKTTYIHTEYSEGKRKMYFIDENLQNHKKDLTKNQRFYKNLHLYCVIFILPIYVLAQPFFGDFGVSLKIRDYVGNIKNYSNLDSGIIGINHVYIENIKPRLDSSFQVLYKEPNQLYILKDPLSSKFNDILMSCIFGICLIGKALFMIIYLTFKKRKWLHTYVLMIIKRHGIPQQLISCLELDD